MYKLGVGTVYYKGLTFEVEYEYSKYIPGTHEYPEEQGEFYLESVMYKGGELLELLSKESIEDIEVLCKDKFFN